MNASSSAEAPGAARSTSSQQLRPASKRRRRFVASDACLTTATCAPGTEAQCEWDQKSDHSTCYESVLSQGVPVRISLCPGAHEIQMELRLRCIDADEFLILDHETIARSILLQQGDFALEALPVPWPRAAVARWRDVDVPTDMNVPELLQAVKVCLLWSCAPAALCMVAGYRSFLCL
jgi:hypothetical protein